MDYLARREHSWCELERKLLAKGHAQAVIAQVLNRLVLQDLQSDRRYAQAIARYRYQRGFGPRHIRQQLFRAGVEQGLIESALFAEGLGWDQSLERVWQKKFSNIVDNAKSYTKQRQFLLQRGFEPDRVQALLRQLQD